MNRLWLLLRQKRNRDVLAWIGGGIVVLAAGLWTAFVYIFPSKHEYSGRASAQANCGAIAIGGNVISATITAAAPNSDCSTKQ